MAGRARPMPASCPRRRRVLLADMDAARRPAARASRRGWRSAGPGVDRRDPAAEALARAGRTPRDLDWIEINEAFASVVLAWLRATGANPERVNPGGGHRARPSAGRDRAGLMAKMLAGLRHRRTVRHAAMYGGHATILERLGAWTSGTAIRTCARRATALNPRRREVIPTAGRLFREHGYERTTVRELRRPGLQSAACSIISAAGGDPGRGDGQRHPGSATWWPAGAAQRGAAAGCAVPRVRGACCTARAGTR